MKLVLADQPLRAQSPRLRHHAGIDRLIELVPTDANASLPEFVAINPLSKVPALVTDDGVALFDSPVICEYLDSIGDALPMFPAHGALRWRALKFQAMGDGILDASVPRRGEMMKPQDEGRAAWIARQKAAVDRTLDALEADPPHRSDRYRLDHDRLRTGLSGFPLRRAAMAGGHAEACRLV